MTQPISPDLKGGVKHLNSRQAAPDKENLKAQLAALASQVAEIELEEVQQQEQQRTEAQHEYQQLLKGAEDFRQKAMKAITTTKKEAFEEKMYQCLDAAQTMREEFPFLAEQAEAVQQQKAQQQPKHFVVGSTNALVVMLVIFVASCALTYWIFGGDAKDPLNPLGNTIIQNAPIRAAVTFNIDFMGHLVGFFFIWLLQPYIYQIWHNQIHSERSLKSLLFSDAPASSVLLVSVAAFIAEVWLFITIYNAVVI